jgi:type IV pilus assembly protein PilW
VSVANSQRGLTLIELLVGLTISSFIIVGAVFVYSQSRNTYSLNDTQARIQEYGRYALGVIEPDLQLAGYFGFSNNPADLRYLDNGNEYPVSQLEQIDTKIVMSPAALHACGNNFALDLLVSVQGTNGSYAGTGDCAATGGYQAGTDTFTVRRASTAPATAATAERIQLYVNALKRSNQYVFNSSTAPGTPGTNREIRDLVVRTYYISPASDGRPGFPSLRRKFLSTEAGAPKLSDEEVLPGVEDMQVEFGVDTGDHNSLAGIDKDADANGVPDDPNGVVSRWVLATDNVLSAPPLGRKAQVVAVRVWLRIRADAPEVGYTDTNKYNYADVVDYQPVGADASFRRIVVTSTVYLRNARTL